MFLTSLGKPTKYSQNSVKNVPISRINIARIPQIPRDVFGFYKGFIQCLFKNTKDISCKTSKLLIFRLQIFWA